MSRHALFHRLLAAAVLSLPIVVAAAGPAAADNRHNDRYGGRHHGYDRHWNDRHWDDRHWDDRRRHHRGSGVSGRFIFDLSPPRHRRVQVHPAPVYVQPPAVIYQAPPQAYCREYTSTVRVNGRPVQSFGTACLQPDGSWRIVSMN